MEKNIKKEILLKTDSTWVNNKFNQININNPEVTVLKITIPPNMQLPMHKHPLINIAYVNKGDLTIIMESGDSRTFKQGESFAEVIEDFHYGKNNSSDTVELIVFYIGEKDTALSVNK